MIADNSEIAVETSIQVSFRPSHSLKTTSELWIILPGEFSIGVQSCAIS